MMFYEFIEPYYALIKGELINPIDGNPVTLTAVHIYEESIAKLDGHTDSMKLRAAKGRYVHEDEAFFLFARSLGNESFTEAKRLFKALPKDSLVIIDPALQ
ncbi:hypothetical protein [Paenibacillus campinasensis]|uniref:Uncharacterized protein n=1 Tax=Paenibacillus campinasensis TaxID=66347 RepID=A0A268EIX3_9BACL|nr:hypothetical protein [Paenibacillus campinasensis]PAD73065.1 hypothetical protein CHH67_21030 [Paenibacillus campinasensis]